MSYDLQIIRDRAPRQVSVAREHAIYRDAQRADRTVQKVRNVADLLERGHRPARQHSTAMLVNILA